MRVLDILKSPLVAIDVGTATTRVCFDSSRIFERPSRSAMRAGVVADVAGVAAVVEELLATKRSAWRRRPGAVVCAPTDVSRQEREALIEAVTKGGASVVTIVPEPLAAAIGAGVDVSSEHATAIVDIGEGVTDLAVIRDASIYRSAATRIGCGIVRAVGLLQDPVIDRIAHFVGDTIRELPDDVAAEVIESGIHVTGGGAMVAPLVARIEEVVGLPLKRADEPRTAVIRGAGAMLHYGVRWR